MNTLSSLEAYRSHDLSIMMRTSSGDEINIDLSSQKSLSYEKSQSEGAKKESLSFSEMAAYQFEVKSNGIDAQDTKEIEAFMKIAQPYIDNFLKELDSGEQKNPLNKIAEDIKSVLKPLKSLNDVAQNSAKESLVSLFDNALKESQNIDKIFDEAQKLLDKTLELFDKTFKANLYA